MIESIKRRCGLALGCALLLFTATSISHAQTQTPPPQSPPSQSPPPSQPPAKAQAVEGVYECELVVDNTGTIPFTMMVKRDGDKLSTEVKDGGDLTITGIAVTGDNVTLAASHQDRPFELPGKVTDTGMGGKWEAGGYSGTWTAKRRADAK